VPRIISLLAQPKRLLFRRLLQTYLKKFKYLSTVRYPVLFHTFRFELEHFRIRKQETPLAGKDSVSLSSCSYMHNPPYTEEAKAAKFSGSVRVEGIVGLDGKITDIRLVKSPGLGLDEVIIKTLKKWKCSPAIGANGKPILVIVPFQIYFRKY